MVIQLLFLRSPRLLHIFKFLQLHAVSVSDGPFLAFSIHIRQLCQLIQTGVGEEDLTGPGSLFKKHLIEAVDRRSDGVIQRYFEALLGFGHFVIPVPEKVAGSAYSPYGDHTSCAGRLPSSGVCPNPSHMARTGIASPKCLEPETRFTPKKSDKPFGQSVSLPALIFVAELVASQSAESLAEAWQAWFCSFNAAFCNMILLLLLILRQWCLTIA